MHRGQTLPGMMRYFLSPEHSDFTIVCRPNEPSFDQASEHASGSKASAPCPAPTRIPCHRIVLGSASSYFDAMLDSEFQEAASKESVLRGTDRAVRVLLAAVYTGTGSCRRPENRSDLQDAVVHALVAESIPSDGSFHSDVRRRSSYDLAVAVLLEVIELAHMLQAPAVSLAASSVLRAMCVPTRAKQIVDSVSYIWGATSGQCGSSAAAASSEESGCGDGSPQLIGTRKQVRDVIQGAVSSPFWDCSIEAALLSLEHPSSAPTDAETTAPSLLQSVGLILVAMAT